ncbi:MAG: RNA recognition motif domain-containing protein [Terriglobales bacterium]
MKSIYVGNLNSRTTDETLRTAFASFGNVSKVNIIAGRGFGFVEMANDSEAHAAIEGMTGKSIDGNALTVNEARPKRERH